MPYKMHTRCFNPLPRRSALPWSTMVSAHGQEALKLHQCALENCVEPNRHTFTSLFKACGTLRDLPQGKKLHADAQSKGFTSDAFVASAIVSMYGKCGTIVEAEDVFGAVFQPNIVLWNAMLSAYVKQGQGERALLLYRQMQEEGMSPKVLTFVIALQACGILAAKEKDHVVRGQPIKLRSLEIGQALHSEARRKGYTADVRISTTLVSMYGKCKMAFEAENVFCMSSQHNVVSWNAMLSAYIELGQGESALWLYREMEVQGMKPDELTVVFALQACSILAEKEEGLVTQGQLTKVVSLQIGQALHENAQRKGFAQNVFVGTTLVNVYGKCGAVVDAEDAFSALSQRTVVSWNAMISTYVEQGQVEKAIVLYRQMQKEGVIPDQHTLVFALQACGTLMEKEKVLAEGQSTKLIPILELGQALHREARKKGFAL